MTIQKNYMQTHKMDHVLFANVIKIQIEIAPFKGDSKYSSYLVIEITVLRGDKNLCRKVTLILWDPYV